jgi:hypothetical protein
MRYVSRRLRNFHLLCSRTFFLHTYQTRPINECRCDERLKSKVEESKCLDYTGLFGELEHLKTDLKIETRLMDEMFPSVIGEYVFLKW